VTSSPVAGLGGETAEKANQVGRDVPGRYLRFTAANLGDGGSEGVAWVELVDSGLEEGDELQAASANASEANTSRVLLNICALHTFHGVADRFFVNSNPAA
jgi:hypothetical protein